jgi:hypothetical protein
VNITVIVLVECSSAVATLVESTGAENCTVVKGMMRILAHEVDNVDYLIASLRDHIEASMFDTAAFNGPETPNVVFMTYLGDNSDEALYEASAAPSSSPSSSSSPTAAPTPEVVPTDNSVALIIGMTIPLVVGLIVAALFIQKKRGTMTEVGYRDMMNSDFVLVGTGDHPTSFHEGLYHYMRDGTRYLSTRCEGCLETRKNSFYTDNNLGTIMEEEEFEDVTGLGGKNSAMNVHKCRSALCNRCTTGPENQTCFFAASSNNNGIIISDDTHSLFTDIHSTGASPHISEHIEV